MSNPTLEDFPRRGYTDVYAIAPDGREVHGDLHVILGDDGVILDLVDPGTGEVLLTNGMDIGTLAELLK